MNQDICRAIVVDDEVWIREGIQNNLDWSSLNIQLVGVFENGLDAWEYLESHDVQIIISDIRMPEMSGLEMATRLMSLSRPYPTKIFFLSGYDDFKYVQEAIRLGAIDYLMKPIGIEELTRVLQRGKSEWDHWVKANRHNQPKLTIDNNEMPKSFQITNALDIIQTRFTEELQLTDVADALFISPNYLSRLFRKEMGMPFQDYIGCLRIDHACKLLTTSVLKIYEVGELSGFSTARHFNDKFQKLKGISPGDYRRRYS
ncbi:response regulator [Paenibacillus sp. LMG 31458]|uniref:Response regulator n=1 Tax=Paenibacillus phytorum TaxID=2654977 RepID=A0ABX1Y3X0_9BACL|nr:response regulator [Paenibacillus phytorum]NOU74678.1 response regulator [Paenibacillus phytorum]